jgi:hypothetical protein
MQSASFSWGNGVAAGVLVASSGCLLFTSVSDLRGDKPDAYADASVDAVAERADVTPDAGPQVPVFREIVTLASDPPGVWGIALDATQVYWTNPIEKTVATSSKATPGRRLLASDEFVPRDVASNGLHVYWGDYQIFSAGCEEQIIGSIGPDGSKPGGLNFGRCGARAGLLRIALGATQIYGIDANTNGSLTQFPLDGTPPSVLQTGLGEVTAVVVDRMAIFYARTTGISRFDKSSGLPVDLATQKSAPQDLALDAANLYWVTDAGGVLSLPRSAPAGTPPTTLASDQSSPSRLAVDNAFVYWTNTGDGTVRAVPKGGGVVTTIAFGQMRPFGVAVDDGGVYWTNQGDGTVMVARR